MPKLVNLSAGLDERLLVLEALEQLQSLFHTLDNLWVGVGYFVNI